MAATSALVFATSSRGSGTTDAVTAWARAQTGSTAWQIQCLKFVYDAWTAAGVSRATLDARAGYSPNNDTYPIDEWTYWASGHPPAGQFHSGYDSAPPAGAMIFFSNRAGRTASHATISLGGGLQISPDTSSVSGPQSVDTNSWRTMLGWWIPEDGSTPPPPNPDRDGDGVPNDSDRCPDQAGPSSTGGCPDADGDAVEDGTDRCPDDAGDPYDRGCVVQLSEPIDVDGDGRLDQIHRADGSINTWFSNGDGGWTLRGFSASASYNYGTGRWLAGDVNGDGRTDLVHQWPFGVNTWLSNGDGSWRVVGFSAQQGYGYGQGTWRVGDVNGDGKTDLVHQWTAGINSWLSNGDGTWDVRGGRDSDPSYLYNTGTWLALDLNSDGRTDLAHIHNGGVNAWLSNGDGTWNVVRFRAQDGYGYGQGTWRVGDVNGDGRTDLVHRWQSGVNTWLSNGDGTWDVRGGRDADPSYVYATGTWYALDVNADGKTDLVHRHDGGVNTWLSDGDGSWNVVRFRAQDGYGYAQGTWRVADVNGDGRSDLVHQWVDGVNTWLSNGDGNWTVRGFQAQAGYGYQQGLWFSAACCAGRTTAGLAISTTSLTTGLVGAPYAAALTATGGAGARSWSVASGSLPAGLTLTSAGSLSGTPSTVGSAKVTVRVVDASIPRKVATAALTVKIVAMVVTTPSLSSGVVGKALSATLTSQGGVGTTRWSVGSGALPAGVTLSSAGTLSGTPTAAGTFSFVAKVTDSASPANVATRAFQVKVAPIAVRTTVFKTGAVGRYYQQTLYAWGGVAPFRWAKASGVLPKGLTLTAAGVLSGTATTAGCSTFTVKVFDAQGHAASATFTVVIG